MPAPSQPAAALPRKQWFWVAAVMFTIGWCGNEFTPLLVMYRLHEGMTLNTVNALLAGYVFGIVPALLVGGPLSDRYGRRPLMYPAPWIAALGSGILALSSGDFGWMLIGRLLCGIAIGLAMAVGSSWVKELSVPPYDLRADNGAGARRASIALTLGFGTGAGVAAAIAQWGPSPHSLPFLINVLLIVPFAFLLWKAPETNRWQKSDRSLWSDLKVPKVAHRRFLSVVVPMAPWVFGCAMGAYAILPNIMMPLVPGYEIAFSGLMCVIGVSFGFGIQALGRKIDTPLSARATITAMVIAACGMLLSAWSVAQMNLVLAIFAAAVLGAGYGLTLVSGLQEIQRIATGRDLAGLTAVYYSLTYLGFFVPFILSALNVWFSYMAMLIAGFVIAVLCLVPITLNSKRHLPGS